MWRHRLFDVILLAWPRRLRRRHGRALVQALDASWQEPACSRSRRWWRRLSLVLDGVHAGLAARREAGRSQRGRAERSRMMFEGVLGESRAALRTLIARPLFSAGVALTLAVGIGATTAMFSVMYGVVLRPLAFDQPDRLVVLWEANPTRGYPRMSVAPPNLDDWRRANTTFVDIGAYTDGEMALATETHAELLRVTRMTPNLLDVLRARPALGRPFVAADGEAGAPMVLLLADATWRRLFGADPGIVGRLVSLGGNTAEIIGVMPPDFPFPLPVAFEGTPRTELVDGFVALRSDQLGGRSAHYLRAIGRLQPGVDLPAAEADLRQIAARLEREYPGSNTGWTVRVVPLDEQVVGETRPALVALFGAVGLVLLLACANVAHLLLARSLDRGREVAIRIALGAGRLQLARQFLVEGLLFALVGAAAGILLAGWFVRVLLALAPSSIPRLADVRVDGWTLAAALTAAVLAAVLSSLAPIVHAWRARTSGALRERAGTSTSGARATQRVLLVLEAAMAVTLVVLASLVGRSFLELRGIDPGFRPDNLLMFHVNPTGDPYATAEARVAFLEAMLDRLRALPGVESVGTIDAAPLADNRQGSSFEIEGAPPFPVGAEPAINYGFVSPGYFETADIDVIEGRTFTDRDRAGSEPVTLINETFAREFFPDGSALGRRVFLGVNTQTARRIVGVVRDERHETIGEPPRAGAYAPVLQLYRARFAVLLRTTGDPASLTGAVRETMRQVDPTLPVFDIRPMSQVVAASFDTWRFATQLVTSFAVLALLLAIAGVSAVASHGVASRTKEIGVRVALGAAPRDLRRAVVRPTLALVTAGIIIGLSLTTLGAGLIEQLLYRTSPLAPSAYATAAAVVLAAAFGATWLPARRAARIDPLTALRQE